MKKIIAFLCILLFSSTAIQAEIYVRAVQRFEARYHHGSHQPEYDLVHEFWFGKNCLTLLRHEYCNYEGDLIESAMRLTFDKEKQRIMVANYSESTYVVIPLPMNLPLVVDSTLVESIKNYQINGTIQSTGEKKTIDQKACAVFKITEWIVYGYERFYDRERTIMVTQDVPLDWRLLDELYRWIRSFFNPQGSYLSDLEKINGFIYATEDVRFQRGQEIHSSFKVLEISEKALPENIFDLPNDLNKKAKLTRSDLIALRGIVYLVGW
jgi:hypothetical protein